MYMKKLAIAAVLALAFTPAARTEFPYTFDFISSRPVDLFMDVSLTVRASEGVLDPAVVGWTISLVVENGTIDGLTSGTVLVQAPGGSIEEDLADPAVAEVELAEAADGTRLGIVQRVRLKGGRALSSGTVSPVARFTVTPVDPCALAILHYEDGLPGSAGDLVVNTVTLWDGGTEMTEPRSGPFLGFGQNCNMKGYQIPGDLNADARCDLSDVLWLLGRLFQGQGGRFPCGGDADHLSASDIAVADPNGDGEVDLSDAIHILFWLYLSGSPHVLGEACVELPDCDSTCTL
jgi:hypothetical protein